MADREETVTLVLNAKNLAGAAFSSVGDGFGKLVGTAEGAARKIGQGFENATAAVSNAFGNLTENLLQGGDLGQSFLMLGSFLAGQLAEGLIGQMLEKLAGTTIVEAIAGSLATLGSTIGGVITAAIPVGMALWPVLLVAAIGAGIAFLIANPDIARKVLDFAGGLVSGIVHGLAALPGLLATFFGTVLLGIGTLWLNAVTTIVTLWLSIPGKLAGLGLSIVETIVSGLSSLPGRVADVIRDAFANLRVDVGPFHISGRGITIDLPHIDVPQINLPHFASGGWAGLNGPQLAVLGENEPEAVIPRSQLGGLGAGRGGSPVVVQLTVGGRVLAELVDERLYYLLNAASPTAANV